MNIVNRNVLEFDELLSLIEGYAGSPLGKAAARALTPFEGQPAAVARLERAAEAAEYIRCSSGSRESAEGRAPARTLPLHFSGFSDPEPLLAKLSVEGTTLEATEIAALLDFADKAVDIRHTLVGVESRFPVLAAVAAQTGDFHSLLRDLRGKILPSGELDDHASPELKRIRREVERQRAQILSSLREFLRGQPEDSAPQEDIITVRGDRFVVPVRAQRRSRAQGVVHGSSSSGQTVYLEPLEAIDLNNELVRLREQEQREVWRILQEMTARLRERAGELKETAVCLATLDLAFASGRFAREYRCATPRFSDASAPRLVLKEARHPLLEALVRRSGKGGGVVPLSVALDAESHVLVISGPNTGGKTVALKTIGLLALMALAGLPVPADEAEFPFFDRVLADIGDYQSIEESLSTFSAHLLNIASMMEAAMEAAGRGSLILLDELGSATDPEEAGALGVAVVERFRTSGAFTIASTHHMALKAYSTGTPGVLSGHMGFDEATLEPTYKLEMGWPGKSSGLAIAQRLGLPADVLERARQSLSSAHREVEEFLSRLREQEAELARLRAETQQEKETLAQKEREWAESSRQRMAEQTTAWERQLEDLGRSFEQRAEARLRELEARQPSGKGGAGAKRQAARMASGLRERAGEELRHARISHLGGEGVAASAAAPSVLVGDKVRLRSLGQWGTVRNRADDWLEVEVGRLRVRAEPEDVAEVMAAAEPEKPPAASRVNIRFEQAAQGSLSEINVIGENADEARRRVDKFLDNAFLAQMERVRVVHGSGKGILRNALAEMFSEHPHVEKFSPAPQQEGGAGATIVELKT